MTLLEPIMSVCVTSPLEFQTNISNVICKRNGIISKVFTTETHVDVYALVALNNMFGAHKELSSLTRGCASFSMEFEKYSIADDKLKNEIIETRKNKTNNA